MLPRRILSFGVHRGEIAPDFLGSHDHAWLRDLIREFDRLAGRPERALEERLQRALPRPAPRGKVRMAAYVLKRLARSAAGPSAGHPSPAQVRRALARAATLARRSPAPGDPAGRARRQVAERFELSVEELEARFTADLPGARPLPPLPAGLTAAEVLRTTNHALASGLLSRATHVELFVTDEVRRVVRYARLRGLICTVASAAGGGGAAAAGARGRARRNAETRLQISGPMALFQRTRLYGRALASLLGQLSACRRWRLNASVLLTSGPEELRLQLDARDRLLPDPGPDDYDSEVERRFVQDFERRWPEWEVHREPAALDSGDSLSFPDFELVRTTGPRRRMLLEIVGFWTPEYLERKLDRFAAAGRSDVILCVDEARACADEVGDYGGPVIPYRRRIDVDRLAPFLDGGS